MVTISCSLSPLLNFPCSKNIHVNLLTFPSVYSKVHFSAERVDVYHVTKNNFIINWNTKISVKEGLGFFIRKISNNCNWLQI